MEKKTFIIFITLFSLSISEVIKLPPPDMENGIGLFDALNKRKSERDFHDELSMTDQEISQILWAGYGPNREDGKKTVPSSNGCYPFDIYVFLKKGTYMYKPIENELELLKKEDLRIISGENDYVKNASMDLCFMGMYKRQIKAKDREGAEKEMRMDSGFVSQNMYLAAASLGLQAVVRGNFKSDKIFNAFGISAEDYYIPLCFSVSR